MTDDDRADGVDDAGDDRSPTEDTMTDTADDDGAPNRDQERSEQEARSEQEERSEQEARSEQEERSEQEARSEQEERSEQDEGRDLRRTLNYVLLAGLSLLALIATLQLYLNVSATINQWISQEYRSLFQAAFNLVVLLLVGTGMVWQVRRLRA